MKKINLPENLTQINDEVFSYCYNLEEIIFPKNLTSVGDEAFWDCINLKKIIYHKNTEEILKDYFGKYFDEFEKVVI